MHLTSGFELSNELAFNLLSFDVVMTSFVTSQSHFRKLSKRWVFSQFGICPLERAKYVVLNLIKEKT